MHTVLFTGNEINPSWQKIDATSSTLNQLDHTAGQLRNLGFEVTGIGLLMAYAGKSALSIRVTPGLNGRREETVFELVHDNRLNPLETNFTTNCGRIAELPDDAFGRLEKTWQQIYSRLVFDYVLSLAYTGIYLADSLVGRGTLIDANRSYTMQTVPVLTDTLNAA